MMLMIIFGQDSKMAAKTGDRDSPPPSLSLKSAARSCAPDRKTDRGGDPDLAFFCFFQRPGPPPPPPLRPNSIHSTERLLSFLPSPNLNPDSLPRIIPFRPITYHQITAAVVIIILFLIAFSSGGRGRTFLLQLRQRQKRRRRKKE